MEQAFQYLFNFTDYVLHHAGQILVSFIVLFILWSLVRALLRTIIRDTAEVFGIKRRRKGEELRGKEPANVEEAVVKAVDISKIVGEEVEKEVGTRKERRKKKEEEPQPIMVAHPLDIKDEASRRLFEEEVEKEKERMRLRTKSD